MTTPRQIENAAASLSRLISVCGWFVLLLAALSPFATRAADGPIQLQVVGGVATVSQYTNYEAPFWLREVPLLTHGRIKAEIHPFDQSGLSGQEILQLMRLGVVPFGTVQLAMVSADDPELNAVDLPLLSPDIASLRETVKLYRAHLRRILRTRYGIELLGVYAYGAQVLFCAKPFATLEDLSGRKVRTSSVSQSEMMTALGAIPVMTAFSGIVSAIRDNVAECAITGTLNGNQVGLPVVTSYVSPMAISWGVTVFAANSAAWEQLPLDIQETLRAGIHRLEATIWHAAERETTGGLACDTGAAGCVDGKPFHMTLVPVTAADMTLRTRLLEKSILPDWVRRCGNDCVTAWNGTLGEALGLPVPAE